MAQTACKVHQWNNCFDGTDRADSAGMDRVLNVLVKHLAPHLVPCNVHRLKRLEGHRINRKLWFHKSDDSLSLVYYDNNFNTHKNLSSSVTLTTTRASVLYFLKHSNTDRYP